MTFEFSRFRPNFWSDFSILYQEYMMEQEVVARNSWKIPFPEIASIVPGKWRHFQESSELCHLLLRHVLLIQNHKVGPNFHDFGLGQFLENDVISQESPESCQNRWKGQISGPISRFCIGGTWWCRRWHNFGDSWKWGHFLGTIEAIPGTDVIFLEFPGTEIVKIWSDFAILYRKNVMT